MFQTAFCLLTMFFYLAFGIVCHGQVHNLSVKLENVPELNLSEDNRAIVWKTEIDERCSDILINKDRVVVFSMHSNVRQGVKETAPSICCFDRETGELEWKWVLGRAKNWRADLPDTPIRTFSELKTGRLTFVSNNSLLLCLDISNYRAISELENQTTNYKPKTIWELDLASDHQVSRTELSDTACRVGGVILFRGSYYVVTGHGAGFSNFAGPAPVFMKVAESNGDIEWTNADLVVGHRAGHFAGPAIVEQSGRSLVVFPGSDCYLYAYDTENMALEWKIDCGDKNIGFPKNQPRFFSPPTVEDDIMVVSTAQSFENLAEKNIVTAYYHLRGSEPKVKWKWETQGFRGTYAPITIGDGMVFVTDVSGSLFAIDLSTGNTRWWVNSGTDQSLNPFAGAVSDASSKCVFAPFSSALLVISSESEPHVYSKLTFGEHEVTSTPRVADGQLVFAAGQVLYCISISKLMEFQ